jgi:uncharacterized protein
MSDDTAAPVGAPSAVLMALYQGNIEQARALAEAQRVSLSELAAFGDVDAVAERLRTSPAEVHDWSPDGWTPLHLAAFFGHVSVIVLLVRAGADLGRLSRGAQGNTALHAGIAGRCDMGVVAALLAAGASPSVCDAQGYAPLHLAASRGDRAMVTLLLACGADAAVRTTNGRLASDIAEERGFPDVRALLVEKGPTA